MIPVFRNPLNRLVTSGRELLLAVADASGLPVFDRRLAGKSVILMYHGVVPERPSLFNWRHVSVADFECHLQMLKKHSNILSVAELHAGKISASKLNVALTFDDGFRNNFLYALPLLQKYRIPASFYLTGANEIGVTFLWPDFLDIVSRHADRDVEIEGRRYVKRTKAYVDAETGESLAAIIKTKRPEYAFKQAMFESFKRWEPNLYRPDYRSYWELMSDKEISQTSKTGLVTIGNHGYYHNNLGELPLQDALEELGRSQLYLGRITSLPVNELAFPDGSYSPELLASAARLGLNVFLGVNHQFGENPDTSTPFKREGLYSFHRRRSQLLSTLAETN